MIKKECINTQRGRAAGAKDDQREAPGQVIILYPVTQIILYPGQGPQVGVHEGQRGWRPGRGQYFAAKGNDYGYEIRRKKLETPILIMA